MNLLQRTQLERTYHVAPQIGTITTTGGTNDDITSILTTLSSNENIPLQIAVQSSTKAMGYVLNDKTPVWLAGTETAFTDGNGNEVYIKLTKPSSNYLINYYSLVNGTETAFTIDASIEIDFAVNYYYDDLKLPEDALVRVSKARMGEDPSSKAELFSEVLTITALNTISNLTKTPVAGKPINFKVNGLTYSVVAGYFSVVNKAVTWNFNASAGGFDILTSHTVEVDYLVNV